MKIIAIIPLLISGLSFTVAGQVKKKAPPVQQIIANRAPLYQKPYIELPLGAIEPQGWLKTMLVNQKDGATGQLDKLYPLVMNQRNGWLGGDGDQWERGPYWIDGLLPLAYILKDTALIAKVRPWVEWSIKSQQPDGYFGPSTDYPYEPGIQRDNSRDWWPKMVMLKVLKQYYSASGDQRVVTALSFPFHLRIPAWCKQATIKINGEVFKQSEGNQIVKIDRTWKSGDLLELLLPMQISKSRWYENSMAIERGPITYALKIEEKIKHVKNDKDPIEYGATYDEVRPASPWNYGLIEVPDDKLQESYVVEKKSNVASYPWTLEHAPVIIRTKAKRIPSWDLYNEMTGPIPYSITYGLETGPEEEVILVPYGCTKLRISQFPVVRK